MPTDIIKFRSEINDIFKENGRLQQKLTNFYYRKSQQEMALLIAEAIASGDKVAMIEAATGIGKSFAYLIPALIYNKRTIVSTANLYLQDQLVNKDIPWILDFLKSSSKIMVLKGRRNYLCLQKLKLKRADLFDANSNYIDGLIEWSEVTSTGDLSEIKSLASSSELAKFTVSSEECLGRNCDFYDNCFLYKQRSKALKSNFLVVNHDILLQDLLLREKNQVGILPQAECYIVDEAHHLHDKATKTFSKEISSAEIKRICDTTKILAQSSEPVRYALSQVSSANEYLINQLVSRNTKIIRYDLLQDLLHQNHAWKRLTVAIKELASELAQLHDNIEKTTIPLLMLNSVLEQMDDYFIDNTPHAKYCVISQSEYRLISSPLSVAKEYQTKIKEYLPAASWIYTSATLSVGGKLDSYRSQLGYTTDVIEGIFPSPFDLKKKAMLYAPKDLPDPYKNYRQYMIEYISLCAKLIIKNNGSALMLFSSKDNLKLGHTLLQAELEKCDPPFDLLLQNSEPSRQLVRKFVSSQKSVLMGMKQFTEGLDIVGKNLSLVMIDKVPFFSPIDPLYQQRIEWYRTNIGEPFINLQLPDAILILKQAVGRLIRSEDDYGVVVFGDSRIGQKNWGKIVLKEFSDYKKAKTSKSVITFINKYQKKPRKNQQKNE